MNGIRFLFLYFWKSRYKIYIWLWGGILMYASGGALTFRDRYYLHYGIPRSQRRFRWININHSIGHFHFWVLFLPNKNLIFMFWCFRVCLKIAGHTYHPHAVLLFLLFFQIYVFHYEPIFQVLHATYIQYSKKKKIILKIYLLWPTKRF